MNVPLLLHVLGRRRRLRVAERESRPQLMARQARALAALRRHAYARSPFYREFHADRYDAPLHQLPVLSKQTMMARFDDLVTDPTLRRAELEAHLATVRGDERFKGYRVASSSGSTGMPAVFVFGPAEWVAMLASFDRGTRWSGFALNPTSRRRVAAVTSTVSWHVSPRVTASTENWWVPMLRMDAADPIDRIVRRLNDWQPKLLIVYPSLARALASEQRAGRLRVAPAMVLTGSEVLTAATRSAIEDVWHVSPFDQYAATEAGNIAAECDHHKGLHLFEDHVIAEVVDRNNQPVAEGTLGEKLLLTVLFGRTQPLIRYELADMIQLSPAPCVCGRPFALIERIVARTDEFLELLNARGDMVPVHPIVFERVLDRVPAVAWQVVRDDAGLTIRFQDLADSVAAQTVVASVSAELAARGVVPPLIRVDRVSHIARGATGKAPRLVP